MTDTLSRVKEHFNRAAEMRAQAAVGELSRVYADIYRQVLSEQMLLLQESQRRREQGETLTRHQVMELARYRRLTEQAETMLGDYAAAVGERTRAESMAAAADALEQTVDQLLPELAAASGLRWEHVEALQREWARMDPDAVRELIAAMQDGSPLRTQTLADLPDEVMERVEDTLATGIAAGWSEGRLVETMRLEAWGYAKWRAERIVRTEIYRAHRAATIAGYRANSDIVVGWRWHSALDTRTCLSCVALHGTLFPLSESLDDHPRGRCVALPELKSWAELGLPGDLPEWGAGQEGDGIRWFEGLDADAQQFMLGPGKFDAWQRGEFDLRQLTSARWDEDWGRTFVETPLWAVLEGMGGLDAPTVEGEMREAAE